MSTHTTTRPAIDTLADLEVGAIFRAGGKVYVMSDGFETMPAAGRGWFNAFDVAGRPTRVKVTTKTVVSIIGRRY